LKIHSETSTTAEAEDCSEDADENSAELALEELSEDEVSGEFIAPADELLEKELLELLSSLACPAVASSEGWEN